MAAIAGMSGLSVLCNAVCVDGAAAGEGRRLSCKEAAGQTASGPRPPDQPRQGPVMYFSDANLELMEPRVREGEILHLSPEDGKSFRKVKLALYVNGISIQSLRGEGPEGNPGFPITIAWSPFSLVQACRLHTVQADASQPWMRLFKVSIFHHGLTHFFATQGEKADIERARWVADVSRVLRALTQSLYPSFSISVDPLPGADWTETRLLAGYLLLYDDLGVSLVYGELHAHCDTAAAFAAYEDDWCDVQVVHLSIDMHTCVSERVGIDCSCFSLGDHHFSTRSCAEKMLWLRAISNVKVKLRHWAASPSATELSHYRASVLEHARGLPKPLETEGFPRGPLLPRRNTAALSSGPAAVTWAMRNSPPSPASGSTRTSDGMGGGPGAGLSGPTGGPSMIPNFEDSPRGGAAKGPPAMTAMMAAAAARLNMTSVPQRSTLQVEAEYISEDSVPPPVLPPKAPVDEAPPRPVARQAALLAAPAREAPATCADVAPP